MTDNEPVILVFDPYLNDFYVIERSIDGTRFHNLTAKTEPEARNEAEQLGFTNLPFHIIKDCH